MIHRVLTLTLLLLAAAVQAPACCMVPMRFEGDVDQAGQEVVVFFHDGHQEMVIRVEPFFQDNVNENGDVVLPEYIEWVITVPNKPTKYDLASRDIFGAASELASSLQRIANRQAPRPVSWGCGVKEDAAVNSAALGYDSLDISEPIAVGPYSITEVRARGADALGQLNGYLAGRGYPEEDDDHMKWFVDNEFTFLCIHITPPSGNAKLGERLDLEPLQVGFDTDKPYYPGKFSSRQGDFALRLRLLTSQPLDDSSLSDMQRRLKARVWGNVYSNLWTAQPLHESMANALTGAGLDWKPERWFVNAIDSAGFNPKDDNGDPTIWQWKDDVSFALGTIDDLPPDWYYGSVEKGTEFQNPWSAVAFIETVPRGKFRLGSGFWIVVGLILLVVTLVILRFASKRNSAEG